MDGFEEGAGRGSGKKSPAMGRKFWVLGPPVKNRDHTENEMHKKFLMGAWIQNKKGSVVWEKVGGEVGVGWACCSSSRWHLVLVLVLPTAGR